MDAVSDASAPLAGNEPDRTVELPGSRPPAPASRLRPLPAWGGYVLAVALVAAVTSLRLLLREQGLVQGSPFLLFSFPILISAWLGGLAPGLLALALALAAIGGLFLDPREGSREAWSLGVFAVEGALISALGDHLRRTLDRLRQSQADLESRVRVRTAALQGAVDQLYSEAVERERISQDLADTARRLEISNRELQDFASVASHDLQEPLRKIQAFGDRLGSRYAGQLGPEGGDYLRRMQSAAGRMQTLINDLLAFSRVTTKAQPFVPVDLGQVAREVVSDLEARIEQAGATLDDVGIGELPTVEADPTQMRQLFQNLIGNALKFVPAGVVPRVRVFVEALAPTSATAPTAEADPSGSGPETCTIAVEDNGIGFDEKYLDRIFTVFQRLHGRDAYEGTGIGLAVCRKIAERHGGSITARSQPGHGATFLVTLPLRQPQTSQETTP
jgi:signal transduction histidine kinase